MIVKFVRHGETDLNSPIRKMQGISNYDLNANGIEQAQSTRDKLSNVKIDIIISSPLKRAKHTAEIINESHNLDIIYDDRIKERNYGDLEGKEYNIGYFNLNYDYKTIGGEDLESYRTRLMDFIADVKNNYSDKNVLVVAHNGVISVINCLINGYPEDNNFSKCGIKNGEIKEFIF